MTNERLIDAALPIVRTLNPPSTYDRARRIDAAIDAQGRPILDGRDFIPLRSPDGSTWRIRVDNSGTLTSTKET